MCVDTFFFTLICFCNGEFMHCNGSIGDCDEADEMLMESETSRRFLEQKRYISPGALKRDQPVCPAASGGCLPQPSNPYNRGCSKYYRCRSDS
ncbi:Methyltransferase family protein [Hibiscus syriacus]|uniref:Methyltransferase family protein n=1 Tax=Hibiscus syriacus TaxID=106335 RepID=A0A6A3CB22_HIBSY|nr:protein RALF-like 32 [Hibiscus syriacus]KAE8725946.1 Methyltransferase family protein [Hibiscus syriacus]